MPNFDRTTEIAGTGEYIQLEFSVQETPLTSDAEYVKEINAQLNGDDRFIIARPASSVIHGSSTLGIGYGATEAVIRTTALANNVRYDDIFANFSSFGGIFFPNIRLIDWNYVTNSNDTQLNNGIAPPMMATGVPPTPLQTVLSSDPIKSVTDPIASALGAAGNAGAAVAKTSATIVEMAIVAVGLIAAAWLYTEYKKK